MPHLLHESRRVGSAAELIAAYRFTEAQRIPSWPLVPMAYDFIVDCGDSLQRVQVKAAQFKQGTQWSVRLTKRSEKKDQPIVAACLDYVCVVCSPSRIYVLPANQIRSLRQPDCLVPRLVIYENGDRFAAYLNNFALGSGLGSGDLAQPAVVQERWTPTTPIENEYARKRHQRLPVELVNELRRLLGDRPNPVELRRAAAHYGIVPGTLRNLLKGRRKDLQPLVTPEQES